MHNRDTITIVNTRKYEQNTCCMQRANRKYDDRKFASLHHNIIILVSNPYEGICPCSRDRPRDDGACNGADYSGGPQVSHLRLCTSWHCPRHAAALLRSSPSGCTWLYDSDYAAYCWFIYYSYYWCQDRDILHVLSRANYIHLVLRQQQSEDDCAHLVDPSVPLPHAISPEPAVLPMPLNSSILIHLNEAIPSSVFMSCELNNVFELHGIKDEPCECIATYDTSTHTIRLKPVHILASNCAYTVIINGYLLGSFLNAFVRIETESIGPIRVIARNASTMTSCLVSISRQMSMFTELCCAIATRTQSRSRCCCLWWVLKEGIDMMCSSIILNYSIIKIHAVPRMIYIDLYFRVSCIGHLVCKRSNGIDFPVVSNDDVCTLTDGDIIEYICANRPATPPAVPAVTQRSPCFSSEVCLSCNNWSANVSRCHFLLFVSRYNGFLL